MKLLEENEVSLHTHEVRSDPSLLKALLHPDYREKGYSGATHTFPDVLEKLPRKTCENHTIWSQGFESYVLSADTRLLVYLSANLHPSGKLFRHAKRSSIWVNVGGTWLLRFHQATPVAEFEREKQPSHG